MKEIIEGILSNADRVTSFSLLLGIIAALIYVVYAFSTGKLPSPGDFKRLTTDYDEHKKACSEIDETLDHVTQELADSRVLHAAATVRIEYLDADSRRKETELSDARARIARLEAELDTNRQWKRARQSGGST